MKDLKEALPTISKEKNIILIVAIVVLVIFILVMLYLTFGQSINLQSTRVEPALIKYKKRFTTIFDKDMLNSTKFTNLKKHGDWPVSVEGQGKEEPFEPFPELLIIEKSTIEEDTIE